MGLDSSRCKSQDWAPVGRIPACTTCTHPMWAVIGTRVQLRRGRVEQDFHLLSHFDLVGRLSQ